VTCTTMGADRRCAISKKSLERAVSHSPSLSEGLVRTATLRVGRYHTPLGRWLACCLLGLLGGCGNARAHPSLSADIPAGPVAAALANFARQTGLQLVYVSEIAKGRTSPGARVGTSPAQALTQLLAGTGLGYTFVNDRTVLIYVLVAFPETPRTRGDQRSASPAVTDSSFAVVDSQR
jgi:hypothetical protein